MFAWFDRVFDNPSGEVIVTLAVKLPPALKGDKYLARKQKVTWIRASIEQPTQ